MSGFVGIVNLNGQPVEPAVLARVAARLAFRGPDGLTTWIDGGVALGHALFTTLPAPRQRQEPATIDGRLRIVSHARLDDRRGLETALEQRGERPLNTATDAELILHAYRAWGEDCVDHLLGDFSFLIWDPDRRRVFCARDQFGVRPLFYALRLDCLIVSNTLRAVLTHPSVPTDLDEAAVAELLLFGNYQDPTMTGFAAPRRLPAAHALEFSDTGLRVRRYWQLTPDTETRYRRQIEYLEHFKELFGRSIDERLPDSRFTIMMSGGLDSTSIAVESVKALRRRGRPLNVRAHTFVYNRLVPDEERTFAQAAADAAGIPIDFFAGDDYQPFERWDDRRLFACEPMADPLATQGVAFCGGAASIGRVTLDGTGGDSVLSELTTRHFGALVRRRRFGRLAAEMADYVRFNHGLPPVGLRTALRRLMSGRRSEVPPALPSWIRPSLVEQHDLEERWHKWFDKPDWTHFLRPRAQLILTSLGWSTTMENVDPGITLVPLEFRHPLADLRLIEYVVSIPAVPWCVDKRLLRETLKDHLPDVVRLRPKTPARTKPLLEMLKRPEAAWIDRMPVDSALDSYVTHGKLPRVTGSRAGRHMVRDLYPVCVNFWLRQQAMISPKGEVVNV